MAETLALDVAQGELQSYAAGALLLKHAQGFLGADEVVASLLGEVGVSRQALRLPPGVHVVVPTQGALGAPVAVFLGTPPLAAFGYHEIRRFAVRALQLLERELPDLRHLATTVHGPNFGLDENEAVLALVGGFLEAWQRGQGPKGLERITLVERREARAKRLAVALEHGLDGVPGLQVLDGRIVVRRAQAERAVAATATNGQGVEKPHAFVAMPFAAELDDVYHYGIQGPVRAKGWLCERVDQAAFDGPIIQRIRERIESARVVIADLSLANPNVYLEVGYAWGRGTPTVLLVRDVKELKFDVASYRCVVYSSIRDLEARLAQELERL